VLAVKAAQAIDGCEGGRQGGRVENGGVLLILAAEHALCEGAAGSAQVSHKLDDRRVAPDGPVVWREENGGLRLVGAVSRVLENELGTRCDAGADDADSALDEKVGERQLGAVAGGQVGVGEARRVQARAHDGWPTVGAACRLEVAADREGTAWWGGEDAEELAGFGSSDELEVDSVGADVVPRAAAGDGVAVDHRALETVLREVGGEAVGALVWSREEHEHALRLLSLERAAADSLVESLVERGGRVGHRWRCSRSYLAGRER
jgi:hypothetical protein